ncbi:MAG: DUF177 domain-containing protein, partial [Acidimicrobiales bacterium]
MAVSGRLDPSVSHGFVVDVVPLLRWPGNRCDVHIHEVMNYVSLSASTATSVDGVLVAESMADSLTVTGTLDAGWSGECRRCLESAEGTVQVEIAEVYERDPVEGETYGLSGEKVDLEPMVRELVL